jgi:hypothetical protein
LEKGFDACRGHGLGGFRNAVSHRKSSLPTGIGKDPGELGKEHHNQGLDLVLRLLLLHHSSAYANAPVPDTSPPDRLARSRLVPPRSNRHSGDRHRVQPIGLRA